MEEKVPKIGLVLMIGLPGSGKTTLSQLAKTRLGEGHDHAYEVHLVEFDDLIPVSIQSHGDGTSWKNARHDVATKVSGMIKQMKECKESCTKKPILLFIDDNMYYRSMRYEYFQMARLHEISFCQIYLSITLEVALRANLLRQTNTVPEEIIKRMEKRMQPPDTVHNIWEQHSLTLTAHDIKFSEIESLLERSLAEPVKRLTAAAEPSIKQSVVHAVDLELRRLVGRTMRVQRGDAEALKARAASLNEQRVRLLGQLRVGDLRLPSDEAASAFLARQFEDQLVNVIALTVDAAARQVPESEM